MVRLLAPLVLLGFLSSSPANGQSPFTPSAEALQGFLEGLKPALLEAVPHPLYEKTHNWGKQSRTFHAVRWKGLKPRIVKTPKNDGTWRKIRVDTRNWPHSLTTKIYDVKLVNPETMTFKLNLACQAGIEIEQQVWESGLRLWSGSLRARAQFMATLECESTMKLDTSGTLPDFIFRLRVTKANVMYHDPVVEHLAGFGGTAAKVVGELVHDVVHQVNPSLEEKLVERVNRSIVRAADTKEVRLSLSKLLNKKK